MSIPLYHQCDAMSTNQKGRDCDPIPTRRDRHCLRMEARHYGKPTYAFASADRHYNMETLREHSHIIRQLAEGSMLSISLNGKFVSLHIKENPNYSKSVRFCYYS